VLTNSDQLETSAKYDPFWSFVLNVTMFVGMGFIVQIVQRLFGARSEWLGLILASLAVGLLALLVLRWMRRHTNLINYALRMKHTRPPLVEALMLGALVTALMLVFGFVSTSEIPASIQLVAIITLAIAEGIWVTVVRYITVRYERRLVDPERFPHHVARLRAALKRSEQDLIEPQAADELRKEVGLDQD
jgi:hypothetical protein